MFILLDKILIKKGVEALFIQGGGIALIKKPA